MSPRTTFLLTLGGVILVGIPLYLLTQPVAPVVAPEPLAEVVKSQIYATIRFTGQPQQLRLRHGKAEWLDIATRGNDAYFELELPLNGLVEIEVEAIWPENTAQAVTLTLEPDGHETRSDTQWKDEYSDTLHSIFRFSW